MNDLSSLRMALADFMAQNNRLPTKKYVSEIEELKCKLSNLQEPHEPDRDDCCGSGCTPCVFDTYYDKLEAF